MSDLSRYGKISGIWRAIVKDIDDDKKMLRIKVTIPGLMMKDSETTPWALPVMGKKTDWLPKVDDDKVWIIFEDDDPSKPLWIGRAVAKDQVQDGMKDNYGNLYRIDYDDNGNKIEWIENGFIITDGGGNVITSYFDKDDDDNNYISLKDSHENEYKSDKDGIRIYDLNENEVLTNDDGIKVTDLNDNIVEMTDQGIAVTDANDNEVLLDSNGIKATDLNNNVVECKSSGITITDANNNKVEMTSSGVKITDANGNIVEMKAGKVAITGTAIDFLGATEEFVKGTTFSTWLTIFLTLLNTHTHSGVESGGGTSGTPVSPFTPPVNWLSTTIKGA